MLKGMPIAYHTATQAVIPAAAADAADHAREAVKDAKVVPVHVTALASYTAHFTSQPGNCMRKGYLPYESFITKKVSNLISSRKEDFKMKHLSSKFKIGKQNQDVRGYADCVSYCYTSCYTSCSGGCGGCNNLCLGCQGCTRTCGENCSASCSGRILLYF
jgi:acyl-CoA hydrolase